MVRTVPVCARADSCTAEYKKWIYELNEELETMEARIRDLESQLQQRPDDAQGVPPVAV